jgi:MFS family permease
MTRRPRALRRTQPDAVLTALVAEGFLSRLAFGLVSFALPLYARQLGMSLFAVGLLATFNTLVAIVLKVPAGILADRLGLRRTLLGAVALRSIVSLVLVVAVQPWQLFATRALHGASIAARDPSVAALLAEHGGKRAVGSAFAWYQTAKSIAGALGKAGAGVLLTVTAGSFSLVFLVSFVLSGLPVLLMAWVLRRHGPSEKQDRLAVVDSTTEVATGNDAPPKPARFLGLGFAISGTTSMLSSLWPVLATEYAGLSPAEAGAIYALSLFAVLTGPVFGWLADHVSYGLVLRFRSFANAVSSLVYLVSPNFAGFAAGRILDDAGKAAFKPAWGAVMAHVASYNPRRRARTMGLLSMGEDAGDVVGPVLAGLLWTIGGVPLMLGARIGFAVVAEVYAVVLTRGLRQEPTDVRAR